MTHDLDGKYVVFRYTECDREAEGSCLAFFQLNGKDLQYIVHPAALYEPSQYGYKCVRHPINNNFITPEEQAIEYAKLAGIDDVVAVFTVNDFYGLEFYNENPEILDNEGLVTDWSQYQSVCEGEEEYRDLVEAEINVRFYDFDRGRYFED